jgi:hypothetical protein
MSAQVALRAVTSSDGMTADWYSFTPVFLRDVSNRICNKVRASCWRVCGLYDLLRPNESCQSAVLNLVCARGLQLAGLGRGVLHSSCTNAIERPFNQTRSDPVQTLCTLKMFLVLVGLLEF